MGERRKENSGYRRREKGRERLGDICDMFYKCKQLDNTLEHVIVESALFFFLFFVLVRVWLGFETWFFL